METLREREKRKCEGCTEGRDGALWTFFMIWAQTLTQPGSPGKGGAEKTSNFAYPSTGFLRVQGWEEVECSQAGPTRARTPVPEPLSMGSELLKEQELKRICMTESAR